MAVIKLDGVVDTDGTVGLRVGENTITVEVTAEDGTTIQTYTVTIMLEGTVSFERGEYYVSEGDSVEVTVVLSHALPGNLPITFDLWTYDVSSMPDDYTLLLPLPVSITFGPNQTSAFFTITATQDTVKEGDELVLVYFNFTLPTSVEHVEYSGENLTYGDPDTTIVTIIDDGMTVTPSTLDVDEGATATYTVKLNTAPTGDVTVAIASDDTGAATVSPTSLTFMPTDWNAPQTVTVTGVEDNDRDDENVTLSNNPSGAEYENVSTVDVDLSVTDNDIASVSVSKTALMVGEENTTGNSYTLVLNNQPTANVTVTVAGHSGTDVTPFPITLTFTSTDWETPKTVTVTAANDADTVNDVVTLTHSAASTDIGYQDIPIASVAVTVTDNDTPSMTVTPSPLDVDEGGTAMYTVKLDTAPTSNVTVAITSNDPEAATVSPASLTFMPTDWNAPQTVTVTADEDDDGVNDTATLTHTASGGDYANLTVDLPVTVTDDDSAAILLSETGLTVTEGYAAGSSYTVDAGHPALRHRVGLHYGSCGHGPDAERDDADQQHADLHGGQLAHRADRHGQGGPGR